MARKSGFEKIGLLHTQTAADRDLTSTQDLKERSYQTIITLEDAKATW
jgi:hypothetical protein